jgi:hypothetical protein
LSLADKARSELKAVGLATLFFGTWFSVMLFLKGLVLAEYQIEFHGFWCRMRTRSWAFGVGPSPRG